MSQQVKQGEWEVVHRPTANRTCRRLAVASFLVGFTVGVAALHQATADEPKWAPQKVDKALLGIGEYLCRHFGGLESITPMAVERFTFKCAELAVMPSVHVTLEKSK
jgi:hypothetical protein